MKSFTNYYYIFLLKRYDEDIFLLKRKPNSQNNRVGHLFVKLKIRLDREVDTLKKTLFILKG